MSAKKKECLAFVDGLFPLESDLQKKLKQKTINSPSPSWEVHPRVGKLLEFISILIKPKKILEIGTLHGYSALSLASGLEAQGKLYTIEYEKKRAETAKENFEELGLANQIHVFHGFAPDLLENLEKEGPFDLIFLDADKASYPRYFRWADRNLRVGGVLLVDNLFVRNELVEEKNLSKKKLKASLGMRKFLWEVKNSEKYFVMNLPHSDGFMASIKQKP